MGGNYQTALEAAGATVLAFESFGSYQGDWYAHVIYKGQEGYVRGSYGSCSGCDAFEAEFGYGGERCKDHEYDSKGAKGCEACAQEQTRYQSRLAEFGEGYLGDVVSRENAVKQASRNLDWDMEAKEMVDWLNSN